MCITNALNVKENCDCYFYGYFFTCLTTSYLLTNFSFSIHIFFFGSLNFPEKNFNLSSDRNRNVEVLKCNVG